MSPFVIQYDLNKGDRDDYQHLYDVLESSGAVRVTESTWFIATSWNAIQIRDHLANFIHPKDVLAVNVLAMGMGYASSNLSTEAVAWMKAHLVAKSTGIKKRIGIRKK
jgi:hypothetical protein